MSRLKNLHSSIDCIRASHFSLINSVSVLLPFKQADQALQISPSVFTVSSMSTTESLLVITDEVAKITMLLIPKWSRDSYQNRIDIMPMMWYLMVSIETVVEKVVERRSSNKPVGLLSPELGILYSLRNGMLSSQLRHSLLNVIKSLIKSFRIASRTKAGALGSARARNVHKAVVS